MPTVQYREALQIAKSPGGDLEAVLKLLQTSSEAGDPRATYALATWYLSGNDVVTKDTRLGNKLLRSLRHNNIAEALFDLAVTYDLGLSCKNDPVKAFECYFEAALLGYAQACIQVSEYFRAGEVVPRSISIARAWRNRARQSEKYISPPHRVWLDPSR